MLAADILESLAVGTGGIITFLVAAVWIVVHLACCFVVFSDSSALRSSSGERRRPTLLGPFLWGLVALMLGPLGLGLYWVLNLSALHADVLTDVLADAQAEALADARSDE